MFAQAALAFALLLGLGAVGTGLYAKGRADGRAIEQATDLRERQIGELAAEKAATAAAGAISRIKVQHKTITAEVQREVQTNTVYRDCQHSPEQLQRINAALTGASSPEPAGRGLVPRAGAAGGPELRSDDTQTGGSGRPVP